MERGGPEQQPDGDAYNFVIALCALNRRIPAAWKHLQSMHERNLVPSKTTYNEVLLACARAHRTQIAVDVIKQLEVEALQASVLRTVFTNFTIFWLWIRHTLIAKLVC